VRLNNLASKVLVMSLRQMANDYPAVLTSASVPVLIACAKDSLVAEQRLAMAVKKNRLALAKKAPKTINEQLRRL
jgi:hypothetical protein